MKATQSLAQLMADEIRWRASICGQVRVRDHIARRLASQFDCSQLDLITDWARDELAKDTATKVAT